jgi:hypothetical protein
MPGMLQPKRELTKLNDDHFIVKVWPLTGGDPNSMTLQFTQGQYDAWQAGMNIQRAFPHMNAEGREFLISGLDQAAWDALWKEPDEPEDLDPDQEDVCPHNAAGHSYVFRDDEPEVAYCQFCGQGET